MKVEASIDVVAVAQTSAVRPEPDARFGAVLARVVGGAGADEEAEAEATIDLADAATAIVPASETLAIEGSEVLPVAVDVAVLGAGFVEDEAFVEDAAFVEGAAFVEDEAFVEGEAPAEAAMPTVALPLDGETEPHGATSPVGEQDGITDDCGAGDRMRMPARTELTTSASPSVAAAPAQAVVHASASASAEVLAPEGIGTSTPTRASSTTPARDAPVDPSTDAAAPPHPELGPAPSFADANADGSSAATEPSNDLGATSQRLEIEVASPANEPPTHHAAPPASVDETARAAETAPDGADPQYAADIHEPMRASEPAMQQRIDRIRTVLEQLRPIPDGGVAVDVDLDGFGRIELRVEPVDGGLRVSLGTDEPTALARLEAHRSELEAALRNPGDALALDIHAHGRRARTPRPHAPRRSGEATHVEAAAPIAARRPGRGLVDVVA